MARKFRYARLTRDEDVSYSCHWEFFMNNQTPNEILADAYAWEQLQTEFPRLKQFDGALP
jgi:hypothetical protein